MKIIIDGEIGEGDLVLFAKFLREMWRHREDTLFVNIEKGMEHMSKEECMKIISKIFSDDKDWKKIKVTKKMNKKFDEKMK